MSEPIHLFDSGEPQERIGVYVCHCGTNIAASSMWKKCATGPAGA